MTEQYTQFEGFVNFMCSTCGKFISGNLPVRCVGCGQQYIAITTLTKTMTVQQPGKGTFIKDLKL